jgi:signal transduction histidine kinase
MHSLVIANDMTEKLQMQQRLINEKVTAQKEIAKAIIQTQEQERMEIGKELHDNVNQILTTVKLYIENIRSFPEYQATFIEKTVTLTQKAIDEIRLLSKQLVSPVINDLNFKAAIIELVEHYRWLNLFKIEYTFEADEHLLDKDMQLTLYRIIQEQMNNIVKHAKASFVTISIVTDKESLTVSLTDDGVGFEATTIVDGVGIRNIKNRAEVYKGVVNLHTSPGKGCSLMITFPCIHPS